MIGEINYIYIDKTVEVYSTVFIISAWISELELMIFIFKINVNIYKIYLI